MVQDLQQSILFIILITIITAFSVGKLAAQGFSDETVNAGLNFTHDGDDTGDILPIGTGAAWFDYNNDGNLDLYVTMRTQANKLFHNNGDGTFTDVAASVGLEDASRDGSGVAVADYNNDGYLDIFLANSNGDKLYRNNGDDTFLDITIDAGFNWTDKSRGTSASWGDYDDDGFLDLYVANHEPVSGYSNSSTQDHLYHNNGNETFTDVSDLLIDAGDIFGTGFIGGWTDFDRDGDLDIFLVNDCPFNPTPMRIFRNDGDTHPTLSWNFTEVSEDVGVSDCSNGMGVAIGDFNNDGWMDVFYTDIGEVNLYKNNDGVFSSATNTAGVGGQGGNKYSWGTNFFDYDLDGWTDLFITIGLYRENGIPDPHYNMLFQNNGNGLNFTDISDEMNMNDDGRGRTSVFGDYDNDGDPDVFLMNYNQPAILKRNDNNNGNHYVKIHLVGTVSNLDGIGSFIKLSTPDGNTQYFETRSGSSLGGGDAIDAYFGLGSNTSILSIEVTWPSGIVQLLENQGVDQYLTIQEPFDPCFTLTVTPPVLSNDFEICSGETIPTFTVAAEDGYTVDWYDNVTSGNLLLQNSLTFTPTNAGTYYAFAIDPENGCSSEATQAILIINGLPSVNAGADQSTCLGGTLSFTANATGGNGNYNYAWTENLSTESDLTVTPLSTTTYSVTVTDAKGCFNVDSVSAVIYNPPVAFAGADINLCEGSCFVLNPTSTGEAPPFQFEWNVGEETEVCPTQTTTYTLTVTDAKGCVDDDYFIITVDSLPVVIAGDDLSICTDDCATFTPSAFGGMEPYDYAWSSGSSTVCPADTTTYSVTVTDANNCTNVDEITVAVLEPLVADAGENQNLCPGICFTFSPSVSNGLEPYNYAWSNGEAQVCPTETATYFVTITDGNGCTAMDSILLTVFQPTAVSTSYDLCEGDCITYLATDLNLSTFVIDTQNIESVTLCEEGSFQFGALDENGCTTSAIIDISFIPLPLVDAGVDQTLTCSETAVSIGQEGQNNNIVYQWSNNITEATQTVSENGMYILTATDTLLGCLATDTVLVGIDTIVPVANAGDDIVLTCSEPTAFLDGNDSSQGDDYSYAWTTDNGNILTGENSPNPEIDNTGIYILVVNNETNGCSSNDEVEVTVASEPTITLEAVTQNLCAGESNGIIEIIAANGSPDYEYIWSTGATTAAIDNLPAGNYSVSVTDQNGCEVFTTIEITTPPVIVVELFANAESASDANDGSITANISGGIPDYQLEWSTGSQEDTISDLSPDIYFLTITDANGCMVIDSARVNNFDCAGISVITSGTFNICPGTDEGMIEIEEITGGQSPYQIIWSTNSNENNINNLTAGHYATSVSDANNCEIILQFEITESDTLPPILLMNEFSLYLDENGTASISDEMLENAVSDNCSAVNFLLENVEVSCEDLGVSSQSLILTDQSGLSDTSVISITVIDTIIPVFVFCPESIISANCLEVNYEMPEAIDNCEVEVNLTEGIDSGSTFAEGITTIEYKATDAGGNTAFCSFTITVENNVEATIELSEFTCDIDLPFNADLIPTEGSAPYSFLWNDGSTTSNTSLVAPGPWSWTITDNHGCTLSGEINPEIPDTISIDLLATPETDMESNGTVTSTISGGTAPLTYEWIDESGSIIGNTAVLTDIPVGTYCLIVTDSNGCTTMSCTEIDRITNTVFPSLSNSIIISPNPASKVFSIIFDVDYAYVIPIQMFDVNGKLINVLTKTTGADELKLDISTLAEGVYVLKIQFVEGIIVKKIIISH